MDKNERRWLVCIVILCSLAYGLTIVAKAQARELHNVRTLDDYLIAHRIARLTWSVANEQASDIDQHGKLRSELDTRIRSD